MTRNGKTGRTGRSVLATALCCLAGTLSADNSIDNPYLLDDVLDAYVDDGAFPFLYARIEDANGRVIYEHEIVDDGLLPDTEVDGQTWIRIWSMTKLVTITLVMDLVEDDVLSLDDPVTDYIPEFRELLVATAPGGGALTEAGDGACPLQTAPMATTMTVRDLMNHTAGFHYAVTGIDCLDRLSASADLPSAQDSADLIDRMADLPLIQQPGAAYYYGTNTTVLGVVAERATDTSLAELVRTRITEPLGIRGLRYGLPEGATLLPRFTGKDGTLREARPGELDIFGGGLPRYGANVELYLGGEGMLATADGYADFLRVFANGGTLNDFTLLEPETIAEMTAPHTLVDDPNGHNGYNIWVTRETEDSVGGLWVGGGYEGTHFWIDPERGFVAVIMSQIHATPESGYDRDAAFREAVYEVIVTR